MKMLVSAAATEQEIKLAVFNLWEAGLSWEDISESVYMPLDELLEYPEINDLYNK